jgi:dTMP kinase
MSSQTELLLMYASRVQLLDGVIKPALSNGTWVISDRHDMSSFAYQGGGRQAPLEFIKTLSHNCLGSIRPSLTLYLDISPELGLERARGRGALDRIEKEDMAFFHRTREMYLSLAKDTSKVITIDASQSVDKVKQQITTALTGWYERRFS